MIGQIPILLAEDDENDVILIKRAIRKAGVSNPIQHVPDGEQAIEYLLGAGRFADRIQFPFPTCIITDLKMPRKNGFEVLRWLQENESCRVIPTIVLTSSSQGDDIRRAYQLGANCYFVKPNSSEELFDLLKRIFDFWSKAAVPRLMEC